MALTNVVCSVVASTGLVGSGGTGGDSGIGGFENSGMAFMLLMTMPADDARSVSDSELYDKLTVFFDVLLIILNSLVIAIGAIWRRPPSRTLAREHHNAKQTVCHIYQ